MLKVLDLFSGIGGFSLGLERTGGFQTVVFCEIDPYCRKVLRKHWPDVPIFEDIRELSGDAVGPVDIITGGFPCQDISTAGKQAGLAASRSGLWTELLRVIGKVRPKYAIVENVANLLSGPTEQPGQWFGRVLGDLAEIGFDAEWHCIPASAVGAPHIRDRIWIIAYPASQRQSETRKLRLSKLAEWFPSGRQATVYSDITESGNINTRRSRRSSKGMETTDCTDAWQKRTEGSWSGPIHRESSFSWCQDVGSIQDIVERPDLPPPLFCGARDGIPHWVDRVGACGNAVVPQIPEIIGHAILEAER